MSQNERNLSIAPKKLSQQRLSRLPTSVGRPTYDRQGLQPGIVHLGVGAFHRAHQAVYLDDLLHRPGNESWGICGVGLREPDRVMRDVLTEQDNLFTVVERQGTELTARVVGSHCRQLWGPAVPDQVVEALAAPSTRLVTLTITEAGYCCNDTEGALDVQHPDIVHDLNQPEIPRTIYPYLLRAYEHRRDRGLPPFTLLSCDNIQQNGRLLRSLVLTFAEMTAPGLARFLRDEAAFPNSMVDRITPATTAADRRMVAEYCGIDDGWPVVTEPFRQWVVEDCFSYGRPPWEEVGVEMTYEVEPFERMKLRLLNAGHSALGYLGYLAGHRTIHDIIKDEVFGRFLERLMDSEVAPLLPPLPGVDYGQYARTVRQRFANEALGDQAARICQDGSAKMPKFVLPSIVEQLQLGGDARLLTLVVAGWFRYLTGQDEAGAAYAIQDPMATTLQARALAGGANPEPLLALTNLFDRTLAEHPQFLADLSEGLTQLSKLGVRATVAAWTEQST